MIEILTIVISVLAIIIALGLLVIQYREIYPSSRKTPLPVPLLAPTPDVPSIRWIIGRPPTPAPPASRLHLITQWYRDIDQERQEELEYCFRMHLSSPFDQITVLVHQRDVTIADDGTINLLGSSSVPWNDSRFRIVVTDINRPTFGDLFQAARENKDQENTVIVVANSDIVFDRISERFRYLPLSHAITLARWNIHRFEGIRTNLADCSLQHDPFGSQDVWAIRGSIPTALTTIPFAPGVIGCDHALGSRLLAAGYELFNPALSIKTYHVHTIDTRLDINKRPLSENGVYIPVCSW
jgi:hypothetical protein